MMEELGDEEMASSFSSVALPAVGGLSLSAEFEYNQFVMCGWMLRSSGQL